MKSILIVLGILCFSSIFAQSDFDERLLTKFNAERIEELSNDHPSVIAYWSYYLDNSYKIIQRPSGKSFDKYSEIKIKDVDNFNILTSGLNMDRSSNQYFRIKNSDQILVLLSNEEFSNNFNEFRSKSK